MITCNCKLCKFILADTSANHMTQSLGTLLSHLVQVLYPVALLDIVSSYVLGVPRAVQFVHHLLTLGS